jgi:hypothetical protein
MVLIKINLDEDELPKLDIKLENESQLDTVRYFEVYILFKDNSY